jgi:hypothetical protein
MFFRLLKQYLLTKTPSAYTQCRSKVKISNETLNEYLKRVSVPSGKIYAKNPGTLQDKLTYFAKGGRNKIQVITDFDYTMTKAYHDGKKGLTCTGNFLYIYQILVNKT